MPARAKETVFIDVWSIPPGHQQEMIDVLLDAFEAFRLVDGFIEGGVLTTPDASKMAWYLRIELAEDRQRSEQRQEVCERIRALESIGNSRAEAFERVRVIAPRTDGGPVEVNYGSF